MKDIHPFRLLIKTLIIFLVIDLAFALLNPPIDTLSIYGWLIPGRLRFFLGNRRTSIVSVANLDALFGSHIISSTPKTSTEYRILVVGDSQTWGAAVTPAQTLTEQLNDADLAACGRNLKFYNLAFPYPSVVKDFLILNYALRYKPDLIVWMLTANSLIPSKALNFLTNGNPKVAIETLHQYHLDRYASELSYNPSYWERTIIGQRSYIASFILLQLYGPLWTATGSDYQVAPYNPMDVDLPATREFYGFQPPNLPRSGLYFDVLEETHNMLGKLPVLVVNEPIYIAHGKNSDISYNAKYPRWAYDQYRQFLQASVAQKGWMYLDLYDLIPSQEFTNSILHINSSGEARLAQSLAPEILGIACP